MGNCLNAASKRRCQQHGELLPEEEESLSDSEMRRISQLLREEEEEEEQQQTEEEAEQAAAAAAPPAAAVKVKIVLTRGELEWLMAQLKSGDHQRLDDVLQHVQAHAASAADSKPAAGWRPRLESIVECPETTAALSS